MPVLLELLLPPAGHARTIVPSPAQRKSTGLATAAGAGVKGRDPSF